MSVRSYDAMHASAFPGKQRDHAGDDPDAPAGDMQNRIRFAAAKIHHWLPGGT
jgi:hypothetical protein